MKYSIEGGNLPILRVYLNRGESVFNENGSMAWMSSNITMETSTRGGFLKGLARSFSGESLFLNTYTSQQDNQEIAFATNLPGEIKAMQIDRPIIFQKGAFLCAEESVNLEVAFTKKFSAGLIGGEGFILQKITGSGTAFFEIDGCLTEMQLAPGQEILVDQGHVAYFDESVKYEITKVKGIKNMFFGGEGLFLVKLSGPGKIGLQSLPIRNLAGSILSLAPNNK